MSGVMFNNYNDAWQNRNSTDDTTRQAAQAYLKSYKSTHSSGDVKSAKRAARVESNYEWMETSGAFDGWSDDLKSAFKEQWSRNNWSKNTAQANAIWQGVNVGIQQSNAQKKADREDILAEIEAYKAGFSESTIAQAVATERQAWDEKINSTLQQAVQQAAQQGRVMDSSTYAMLRGRLEAQAADAIQQVQLNYEAKRMEYAANAISMKDAVYRNTTNQVMSYGEAADVIKSMAGEK